MASNSPMVEALKRGTVKAFGTSYFTKINQQNQYQNKDVKAPALSGGDEASSVVPFPSLISEESNRENKLQIFEEMTGSKLNENNQVNDNAELCKSPEQKVKEKRRRRATMFVKGTSTPDDMKSPSFASPRKEYSCDLQHKKRLDFSTTDNSLVTSGTLVSVATCRETVFDSKTNSSPPVVVSNTENVIDREALYEEFKAKYEEEKKVLENRAIEAENKLGMALAEHDALHFMNEVQKQDLEARSDAFSNMMDKIHKEHRSEVKKLKYELSNSETKHAAYTDALVAQMKEHLLTAVTKCKQHAKENVTLKERVNQLQEENNRMKQIENQTPILTEETSFPQPTSEDIITDTVENAKVAVEAVVVAATAVAADSERLMDSNI